MSLNKKNTNNESDNIILFQQEIKTILSLLVKEKSLPVIYEQILQSTSNYINGEFGIIITLKEETNPSFYVYDPFNKISEKNNLEKELRNSLQFITKWLHNNKRALIGEKLPQNICYSILEFLNCNYLAVLPSVIDENIISVMIFGKYDSSFEEYEVQISEQFASLLGFAISSITTRQLNEALEQRLLQSQKLETIGKLSNGIAHDFSNLLSSIFGSINLLKKKIDANDDVLRLLDNIENCSIRAKDLTKGLLSYGKPTPKRKDLVKPKDLLNEILKVVNQTFPGTIKIETEIDEELFDIMGNSTEIYQILLNLCVNAKDAVDEKGILKVIGKKIFINDENFSKYPLLNKGNYVQFAVEDNGKGIKEENLNKIFDPYFSTKDKQGGTGLGLYVTYGIIKAHNGHIEVTSKEGKGTRFDVFIPAFEPAKKVKNAGTEKIILLADDEEMLRELLSELLETCGYYVIKVSNSEEVLEVLTEEIKVDLLIIDFNMPGMNGMDCVINIKDKGISIPIILSTGSLDYREKYSPEELNISAVLQKPYEFEFMLKKIEEII